MRGRFLVPTMLIGLVGCVQSPEGIPQGPGRCEDGKCDGFGPADAEPDRDIGSDEEVWTVVQTHVHTTGMHACSESPLGPGPLPEGECFSADGVASFLEQALDHGATDVLVTDHNSIEAWFDPAFRPLASQDGRIATPLRGTEWTTADGHMNFFFPREVVDSPAEGLETGWMYPDGSKAEPGSEAEYAAAVDAVHAAGGLAIVNHPTLRIHPFPEATYGADAVEVGVKRKMTGALQEPASTRLWWQRRLCEGDRVTGIAGADHHYGESDIPFIDEPLFGVAVNLVRLDPGLPGVRAAAAAAADPARAIDLRSDLVADAIARGSVLVVRDVSSPRVFIGADVDGDGRFHDARAGDCLLAEDLEGIDALPVRVRITQAAAEGTDGHFNVLFWTADSSDEEWFWVELDPETGFEADEHYVRDASDPFAVTVMLPTDGRSRQFLRVEVERDVLGPLNEMAAVTNPIYLGDWGDECEGSSVLH